MLYLISQEIGVESLISILGPQNLQLTIWPLFSDGLVLSVGWISTYGASEDWGDCVCQDHLALPRLKLRQVDQVSGGPISQASRFMAMARLSWRF